MPRIQPKSVSFSEKKNLSDDLWKLVSLLNSREEIENFFRDLLSETEVIMLARRIRIAKLLLEDKSYEQIRSQLKTSYATIAHVHRWLQSGRGGYKNVIPQLEKELARSGRGEKRTGKYPQPFSFEWLRRRYPLHFLLFNLFDKNFFEKK